ncbi:hypothetical protein M0812_26925 [Anaeramoeba flamelloides]|uniref:Uncharacterized protein n=1 Tax=Anaeramoeba flamelloides TaxID=1746091 RepID=A0AAV7YFF7_9EUKA|nr:hypothetical protein M0812_26925 [Anaeramoeba flamelloides]
MKKLEKYKNKDYYPEQENNFQNAISDSELQQKCLHLRAIYPLTEMLVQLAILLPLDVQYVDNNDEKRCKLTREVLIVIAHIRCIKLASVLNTVCQSLKIKFMYRQKEKYLYNGSYETRLRRKNRKNKNNKRYKLTYGRPSARKNEKNQAKRKVRSESLRAVPYNKPVVKEKYSTDPNNSCGISSLKENFQWYNMEKQVNDQKEQEEQYEGINEENDEKTIEEEEQEDQDFEIVQISNTHTTDRLEKTSLETSTHGGLIENQISLDLTVPDFELQSENDSFTNERDIVTEFLDQEALTRLLDKSIYFPQSLCLMDIEPGFENKIFMLYEEN